MASYKEIKMKNLFYIGIFATICLVIISAGNHPPKLESATAKNMPVEAIKVLPAEASAPSVLEQSPVTEPIKELTVEQMIRNTFGKDGDRAVKISFCESGLDPKKVNPHDPVVPSVGLFQINLIESRGLTVEEMQDAQHNIDYAKMIFDKRGWDRDWVNCARKTK
jgi:hypothetical protein